MSNTNSSAFYDNALICSNGHIINDSITEQPENNDNYCSICGGKALEECEKCKTKLRGALLDQDHRIWESLEKAPSFCFNCGTTCPWTISKIEAAMELALENNNLGTFDSNKFKSDLIEISKETPMAAVSATRIVKTLKNITSGAAKIIRELIVDISSETAKKVILQIQ